MTTELSWRYVFAGETVVVIAILLVRRRMPRAPAAGAARPQLDYVGVALSALGLALAVYGILKSSEWGLIEPRGALTIGGTEITPFGFSAVPFFILAGLGFLAAFVLWEERRERQGRDTLLDRTLLRIGPLRAGLTTLMMQQLILLGTFFVLPVYLQVVLGLDAFETGKRLFPMSVTLFLAAMAGPRLAAGFAPKRVAQVGPRWRSPSRRCCCWATIDVELDEAEFALALAIFGVGAGLLLSQLGNVIMSSVDPSKTNEAGGLQGTAQNLGASLGTALIGSVLIAALTSGVSNRDRGEPGGARRPPASASPRSRRRASRSCPSTRSSRRRSRRRACRRTRRRRSPTTTATRSSTGSSARSARSRSSRCCRSGSRGDSRAAADGRGSGSPGGQRGRPARRVSNSASVTTPRSRSSVSSRSVSAGSAGGLLVARRRCRRECTTDLLLGPAPALTRSKPRVEVVGASRDGDVADHLA